MAIAFGLAGTRLLVSTAATTWNVPYPSTVNANDLLVLHVIDSGATITTPTGWTAIVSDGRGGMFIKKATGSETGNLAVTIGSSTGDAMMFSYTGVDTTTAQDATATSITNGVTPTGTIVIPSITTVTANTMLVYCCWQGGSGTDTGPAGSTERVDQGALGGTNFEPGALYDEARAATGATGTRTITIAGGSVINTGAMIALRPATGTNYTPSAADTGAGSDSASQVQSQVQSLPDTGAGSDAMALARTQTYGDTGSGSDTASAVAAVARTAADTGSGTDAASQVINAQNANSDAGTGTDATTPVQGMVRTAADTGSGTDAAVASFILIQSQADTGAGADSITVLQNMQPTVSDTGSGTDSAQIQQSQTLGLQDTGAGADSIATVVQAIQTVADTGAGADGTTQAIGYARAAADTGSGVDTAATAADNVRTIADNGSGADASAQALAVVRAVSDVGSGSDTITQILGMSRTVADTGTGTDAITYTTISNLIDLFLTATPLPTRYAVSEIMARWSVTAMAGRWSTKEFTRWSVQPLANRYTVVGESTVSVDVIISAGAVKYVGGTITDVNGTDISASTFQVSLGSATDPGPWQTPDVSVAGTTNAQRVVKMLVSSSNPTGVIRGTYYCWVRVSSSPEIEPLRVQGPINVR